MEYVIGGCVLVFFVFVTIYVLKQMERTISRLNEMVDSALNGEFEEGKYDESQLSRLESKWKQFIETSVLSKKSLETERKNLQSLLSDISHQTKTPLSNILLYTQLLKETEDLSGNQKELVEQLENQSEKLEFLIKALVKTSRLEAGVITLHPQRQLLLPMIQKAMTQVQALAEQKQIQLKRVDDPDLESKQVCFDLKWTEEAIYNILDNAVKYTQPNGTVEVEVMPYELFTCITVRDTGIGIREEEINQIFKRFYRSKDVQNQDGVGIGLYLTREIIRAQGGYIKVRSEKNNGSAFSIFLQS